MRNLLVLLALFPNLSADVGRVIVGSVVDDKGQPIARVRIDHYGERFSKIITDAAGNFEVQTAAPQIVLRKLGYLPRRVSLDDLRQTIVLTSNRFSTCRCDQSCSFKPYGLLCFPLFSGVTVMKPTTDTDYAAVSYLAHIGKDKEKQDTE